MDVNTTLWNATSGNTTTTVGIPPFLVPYDPYAFTWTHAVEVAVLSFLGLIATPANLLLLCVQVQIKDKGTTDYYVITLGIFDLYGATVNVTMAILHSAFKRYVMSPIFCKIFVFGAYLVAFETAFLICAIAVDRVIMSILPLNKFYSAKVAKWTCVVLACMSFLLTLPYLLFLTLQPVFMYCAYTAGMDKIMDWWNRGLVFLIVVSFGFISVSYFSIAIMLRKRHNQRVKSIGAASTVNTNKNKSSDEGNHTSTTATPNTEKQALEQSSSSALKKKEQAVNRTTMILFAISLMYMIAWGVTSSVILVNFTFPPAFSQLAPLFRRVTMVTNPLLFMSLSSKFRELTKQVFCKR